MEIRRKRKENRKETNMNDKPEKKEK